MKIDYKRIIPDQESRIRILGMLDFLPDKLMIKLQYRIKTGRKLNLENPRRFTEKIQWYKLYYRNPLMTKCADKYNVRSYVAEKGYKNILIPLYGVYEDAEQINFSDLPNEFVLKTTNGSKTNIICENKNELDIEKTKKILNKWLKKRSVKLGREWAYYNIKPRIICEKFIRDEENQFDGINDYKFICFNGKAKYVWVDINRYTNHRRNFYDLNWNYLDIESDVPNCGDIIPRPEGLEKMKQIANKLAEDFPHVRVDLYWANGKIYFGELTFYLLSGYEDFNPDEFDYHLGDLFTIGKTMAYEGS